MVYANCEECNADTGEYIYFVEACDGSFGTYATSTQNNIAVGTIMQFTVSETCVSVGQLVEGFTPTDVLNDIATYFDCNDCNGITPVQVCTEIETQGNSAANGTYILNGSSVTWSIPGNAITSVCAEEGTAIVLAGSAAIRETTVKCTSAGECEIPEPIPCSVIGFGYSADDNDPPVAYQYTNCEGIQVAGFLDPNDSFTDCVRIKPEPQIGQGGTIDLIEPCSVAPPAPCDKTLFSNDSGSAVNYTYTNCDGAIIANSLLPGQSFTDCVRTEPAPEIGAGGTMVIIEPCE